MIGEKNVKKLLNFKSIKTKIMAGFATVILLVTAMSVYSLIAINHGNEDTKEVITKQLPLLVLDEDLKYMMSQSVSATLNYITFDDVEMKNRLDKFYDTFDEIEKEMMEISDLELLDSLFASLNDWKVKINNIIATYESGNKEEALNMYTQLLPHTIELINSFEQLSDEKENNIHELGNDVISAGKSTVIAIAIFATLVLILGILIGYFTSISITIPIAKVMKRMNEVADGDLSQEPLKTIVKDEVAQLINAANKMTQNNRELLSQINLVSTSLTNQSEELMQSAGEVTTGAEQIAATMEELAAGAETQANSAGDLASLMGSFTIKVAEANEHGEQIQNNSSNVLGMTEQGSELMITSTEQMRKINQIVRTAVENVQRLDKQSQEISKLVSVIKDVADLCYTNIWSDIHIYRIIPFTVCFLSLMVKKNVVFC